MFRRIDALKAWVPDAPTTAQEVDLRRDRLTTTTTPDLLTLDEHPSTPRAVHHRADVARVALGARLGAQTWPVLYELALGESKTPYHYEWCREEWVLMLSGAATLRHPDDETTLTSGDIACFPQARPARTNCATTPKTPPG